MGDEQLDGPASEAEALVAGVDDVQVAGLQLDAVKLRRHRTGDDEAHFGPFSASSSLCEKVHRGC